MAGMSEGIRIAVTAAYGSSSVQDAARGSFLGNAVTDGGGADDARRKQDAALSYTQGKQSEANHHSTSCDLRVNVTNTTLSTANVRAHHAPVVAREQLESRHRSVAGKQPPRTQT